MKQTVAGGCHCGAVRFSCQIDLTAPTTRCNCSICHKQRFWLAVVAVDDFTLVQGDDALVEYRFGAERIRHRFCRRCGVKPFGEADNPAFGGRFFAVNVACLEVEPEVLAKLPIQYNDGRHDAYGHAPSVTSYL
jgi:hypothetical protein